MSNEKIGMLLAMLLKFSRKRPRISIINHYLSQNWKSSIFQWFGLASAMDAIICLNEFQTNFAKTVLRIEPKKIFHINYGAMVDGSFFTPAQAQQGGNRYILSVGQENRDYETLMSALHSLNLPATIVPGGMGNPNDSCFSLAASENKLKILYGLSNTALRDLYAGSAFVVVPLRDVEYPAGITTIMEAMAMDKAVIASRSRGISELIEDGKTGMLANVADAEDLRNKILYLWNNPLVAQQMGTNAGAFAREKVDLDCFIEQLGSIITGLNMN
jgi:glycosyltransferase involved in cell wall biosynthesis